MTKDVNDIHVTCTLVNPSAHIYSFSLNGNSLSSSSNEWDCNNLYFGSNNISITVQNEIGNLGFYYNIKIIRQLDEDTTNWDKIVNDSYYDEAVIIKADNLGNIYTAGHIFDASFSNTKWCLKKYNSSGAKQWEKVFYDYCHEKINDMAIDKENNVYIVGCYSNYPYVKKISSSGIEDTANWNKQLDTESNRGAYSVETDSDNNVYISGSGKVGSDNCRWLKKFDKNGNEDITNWDKKYISSDNEYLFDFCIDSSNAIYTAIYSSGNSKLKKYNSNGTEDVTWNKDISWSGMQAEWCELSIDNNNNIYLNGKSSNSSENYYWIKKFSSSGTEDTANWNKSESNYFGKIFFDSENNLYIISYQFMNKMIYKLDKDNNLLRCYKLYEEKSGIRDFEINSLYIDSGYNMFVFCTSTSTSYSNYLDWWIRKIYQ